MTLTPIVRTRMRKAYERLTPEQRKEATDRYRRHLRACEKAAIPPEPLFLFEAIEEIAAGRPLEAEEVMFESLTR